MDTSVKTTSTVDQSNQPLQPPMIAGVPGDSDGISVTIPVLMSAPFGATGETQPQTPRSTEVSTGGSEGTERAGYRGQRRAGRIRMHVELSRPAIGAVVADF